MLGSQQLESDLEGQTRRLEEHEMPDVKRRALFLDGTWNDVSANTNVWRLKSLCQECSCASGGHDNAPEAIRCTLAVPTGAPNPIAKETGDITNGHTRYVRSTVSEKIRTQEIGFSSVAADRPPLNVPDESPPVSHLLFRRFDPIQLLLPSQTRHQKRRVLAGSDT